MTQLNVTSSVNETSSLNVTSSVNETSSLNVTSPAEVFEAFEQFARALSSLFGVTDNEESTDEVKMHQMLNVALLKLSRLQTFKNC